MTDEEKAEKDLLLTKGFGNWNKNELIQFLRGIRRFKSNDLFNIAKHIPTKTLQEVIDYSRVFWERYKEIKKTSQYSVDFIHKYKSTNPLKVTADEDILMTENVQ